MKKKILSLLMASAIVASAFGMVACGGDDGSNGAITGNTDPATITSDRVADEAAWKAAFEFDGVTNYSAKSVSKRTRNGEVASESESVLTMNADKYGIDGTYTSRKYDYETGDYIMEDGKYVMETNIQKSYAAVIDGKNYLYEYDDEKKAWYREETERDVMENINLGFTESKDAYNGFAKFKFENGAYTATFEEDTNSDDLSYTETYTIKIKDGKIVYFGYASESSELNDGETIIKKTASSIIVYDIGKTTVTLPTEYEEEE